jgi:hypothetical protein
MRSLKYLASFTAVALLLCAGAFARDNSKSGSFDLAEPAHIGSTLLQPGHYKAEWTGPENALTVSIMQRGKTVATTQGNMTQLPSKATQSEVTIRTHNDNKQIEQIQFDNRTEALTLSGM